ncbi:MAG TPA: hypothetical protein VED18_08795 [Candidatus Sulfotelmatobacter sp.]|nr:hypothetical protein [Candidatus Sulfotelmatobacter sp.]
MTWPSRIVACLPVLLVLLLPAVARAQATSPTITASSTVVTTPQTGVSTTTTVTTPTLSTAINTTPTGTTFTSTPSNGSVLTVTFSSAPPPALPVPPTRSPQVQFAPTPVNPTMAPPTCAFQDAFDVCAVEW